MRLPVLSGKEVVKLLSKAGFSILDQQGSHLIMLKHVEGRRLKPVVPMHKELAVGTLISIIKQSGMTRDEFLELLRKK